MRNSLKPLGPVFYSDVFTLPLPDGHRFPMTKYRTLRDRLVSENILAAEELFESQLASVEEVELAHDRDYVQRVISGSLANTEIKTIGFPWSEHLVRRSLATVGGAIAAAQNSLETGFSSQLAGGTHHAGTARGAGYCVFNDQAVAARVLLAKYSTRIRKVAIIDLDVHQGDGTAEILSREMDLKTAFVASVHGERNYPFRKVPSSLDIGLPDGANDSIFLSAVKTALEHISRFEPDILLYQAGVDALEHDRLGKLKVSFDGLKRRDALVFEFAKRNRLPLAMAMGGGYSDPISLTVDAHIGTYQQANLIFRTNQC